MRTGKTGVVELPRYVRRVIKDGRAFYYFTKYRGTEAAWPSIPLPDPFDADFAHRKEICDQIERVDGAFVLARKALPNPRDTGFWTAAERVLKEAKRKSASDGKTFTALIALFKHHEQYASLAAATKRGYDHYAELIEASWGSDLVADLTTVDAQEAIDSMSDTPAAANQFRAFLSRLQAFGIPRGFCTVNVVELTEKMASGEPWSPWPEWAFELFFAFAPTKLVLPVVSALFTGQRQVDILKMPRPKKADQTIPVRAQKTGEIVWVPIHSEYRRWIEATPARDSTSLHLNEAGSQYTPDGFRTEWSKMMKAREGSAPVLRRFRQERIVFHGLRKNAVINLLEAGCNEAQVGAIVNMSEQMVRHYGRDVNVRALARDGMRLLENRWHELRPQSLPRTRAERELEN